MLLYYELVGELDNLFVLEFWETTSWDCVTNGTTTRAVLTNSGTYLKLEKKINLIF